MSDPNTKLTLTIEHDTEKHIKLANSYVNKYEIDYETTTCRNNTKRWKAVILDNFEEDAIRNFMKYIESKKHIISCNIIKVNACGRVQLDFGSAIMYPIKPSQLLSFKNEPRIFLKAKIPQTGEWFIPNTINIYRTDFSYATKLGNVKNKSVYMACFDWLDASEGINMFIENYKAKNEAHVFKENILNTRWVGELRLIL